MPLSVLSNGGIYERVRALILQKFDIIALAEFSAKTFQTTGTKTVIAFMRRRALAISMMKHHYDPAYRKSLHSHFDIHNATTYTLQEMKDIAEVAHNR